MKPVDKSAFVLKRQWSVLHLNKK